MIRFAKFRFNRLSFFEARRRWKNSKATRATLKEIAVLLFLRPSKTSAAPCFALFVAISSAVVATAFFCGCRAVPFYRMTNKASQSLPLSREGIAAFERGDLEHAELKLEEAVNLNDSDVETCRYYGETLWRLGKRREAIAVLTAAASKEGTVDAETSLYRSLGEKALETNEPERAVAWANKIVDATPKSAVGWELRGDAELRLGRPAAALSDFQRAVHFADDDRELLRKIATIQNASGDFDGGLATWQYLERLYPANREPAEVFAGKGDAYFGLGLPLEAQEAFEIAIRVAPDSAPYRRRLAEIALARGDANRALAVLDEALARAPEDAASQDLRDYALRVASGRIVQTAQNTQATPIATNAQGEAAVGGGRVF